MEIRNVYLVRHGNVRKEDNQRRYIGQIDLPLNDDGVKQALCLKKRLEPIDFRAVYCSDLSRTRQTAEIIMADKNSISMTLHKGLREIDLGEWEGCTFADIARQFPREFRARGADIGYYCVPGGESFAQCSSRVVAAFHEILTKQSGNILIVGHAGVNRLLLCHMLGMPLANLFRISQDFGCLNIIHCNGSGYCVKLINFK